jgi:hypothetical protein
LVVPMKPQRKKYAEAPKARLIYAGLVGGSRAAINNPC